MTKYDFDSPIDRRNSDSGKWTRYPDDILPLWVADMDFACPPPVIDALHDRVDHAVFGYGGDPAELRAVFCAHLAKQYGWDVAPEAIVFLPGLVSGINVAARAVGAPGDGVLVCTPVYGPFLSSVELQGRSLHNAPLAVSTSHHNGQDALYYEMDFAAIEQATSADTRLHILCNPHNPVGRAFNRTELETLAEHCLRHDFIICSDEIHCDLLLDGAQHIPIAALDPEIAARTITLMAPSKTYNLPGLGCSMAIIPDAELRKRFQRAAAGIVPHVNVLGLVAAQAAYSQCADWLEELQRYLTDNRNFTLQFVKQNMPALATTIPEATFLAWFDCRNAAILGNPYDFFLNNARAALNDGAWFGPGGEGFVRLNFGCLRATLAQALERMAEALSANR